MDGRRKLRLISLTGFEVGALFGEGLERHRRRLPWALIPQDEDLLTLACIDQLFKKISGIKVGGETPWGNPTAGVDSKRLRLVGALGIRRRKPCGRDFVFSVPMTQ